ncbi:MAG TPA: hypothetical protein PLJ35_16890 [Anaerolineae bacterium]|nr:hypothetical protein [Anaerolineae bacterium]HOR00490.1 hypothetical protein [Anaerolineae bacterium]HPL28104.1 hypothetical protein [Anaerolineae bacterium]
MLDERGQFGFTGEVLDLAEQVWCAYQEAQPGPQGARERLLGLAYIVAALRRDVDGVWAELVAAAGAQGVDVTPALHEMPAAAGETPLRAEFERRGWLRG